MSKRPQVRLSVFLASLAAVSIALLGMPSAAFGSTPPPDQLTITGSCITVPELVALAEQAIMAYVVNGPPAGVWVNGNWVPAVALFEAPVSLESC